MKKVLMVLTIFVFVLFFVQPKKANAQGEILGIHILSPQEVPLASTLLDTPDHTEHYITVPLSLSDTNHPDIWQNFFDTTSQQHLIPIIRLATQFENGVWDVPNQEDIIKYSSFLTALDWHQSSLIVVLFNEPNHADEWGGKIDPQGFAQISSFAADWFHTEPKTYIVLPAGLDLAASNTANTFEAFHFWNFALGGSSELLNKFDGWTSHSYPNPNFSSNPNRTGQGSLRGYQLELSFLKTFTDKQFPVYITETGWDQGTLTPYQVRSYYAQAYKIWESDPRIKAVTPFLLQGAPGAFAPFSFLDSNGKPTQAYQAFRTILSTHN